MTVETTLTREQFIRLSLLRHIQRKTFYFYAIMCAVLTAYALVWGPQLLLLVAWVPFILYLLLGLIGALRDGNNKEHPLFQPTRYQFDHKGLSIKSNQGQSQLEWQHFAGWKTMAACYVLFLKAGPMIAIPQSAFSAPQIPEFEGLLRQHIGKG